MTTMISHLRSTSSPTSRYMRSAERNDDDDDMSVSSLGEDAFEDQTDTARQELMHKAKLRQAEELGSRLQVALQVPYTTPKIEGEESTEPSTDPAIAYKEFKNLVSLLDDLSNNMRIKTGEILSAQNAMGRDSDMICEKLESTLKQAVANAKTYYCRIEQLYQFREENRKEYMAQMQSHRSSFEDKLSEERVRSKKEWKAVAEGLASVQDERRSVKGMQSVIMMLLET